MAINVISLSISLVISLSLYLSISPFLSPFLSISPAITLPSPSLSRLLSLPSSLSLFLCYSINIKLILMVQLLRIGFLI